MTSSPIVTCPVSERADELPKSSCSRHLVAQNLGDAPNTLASQGLLLGDEILRLSSPAQASGVECA